MLPLIQESFRWHFLLPAWKYSQGTIISYQSENLFPYSAHKAINSLILSPEGVIPALTILLICWSSESAFICSSSDWLKCGNLKFSPLKLPIGWIFTGRFRKSIPPSGFSFNEESATAGLEVACSWGVSGEAVVLVDSPVVSGFSADFPIRWRISFTRVIWSVESHSLAIANP